MNKPRPTPETDELVRELHKLKSNTLEYPCEVALLNHAKDLERQRDELADALRLMQAALKEAMPGVAHIACQDYAILNDAPVAASKALANLKSK